jgi:endonuclease/exonuclease/phosphatase family metal-dependent hydrolase
MIKVMSFNIRTGSANDGENCWDNRRQMVIDRIRVHSPDLLGIQECRNDSQAEYLKRNLPDYHFIGFERGGDSETALEMTPIFIKRSSFKIEEFGCFWLSETPDLPGSSSWGSVFPRIVTWAKLRGVQEASGFLYFFNTHFDYANSRVQVESSILLRNQIASLENDPPVVLCGDFNVGKESIPYKTLLDGNGTRLGRFNDTYRDVNPGPWIGEGTFHAFGVLDNPFPLDWLLASSHFLTLEAGIDTYHEGNRYPSDHYALVSRLTLLDK